MRLAVFSDVHGNPFALDAVLNAIAQDGAFDRIVVAGDLAFGGSDPIHCIDVIRSAGLAAVYGNTEVYIHSPNQAPGDQLHLNKWERLQEDAHWVRGRIGQERIDWLAALPFDLSFSPTDNAEDELLVFHANPLTVEEMLLPPVEDQARLFGVILQPDDDAELARLMAGVEANTIAFGHYHFTSTRHWRGRRLVNVAPVSMPAKDHDPRARYSIFEWTKGDWRITRRYVEYDYAQEVRALAACGLPHWQDYAATFAPG